MVKICCKNKIKQNNNFSSVHERHQTGHLYVQQYIYYYIIT